MTNPPKEVESLRPIFSDLILAAYAGLDLALDSLPGARNEALESRYWSTLGQLTNYLVLQELTPRLGRNVEWHDDRNFVAIEPRGAALALRLGKCDAMGRPNERREKQDGDASDAPFEAFLRGEQLLFGDNRLRPIFVGYNVIRRGNQDAEVDRVILSRYVDKKLKWAWALDPADARQAQSILRTGRGELAVVPTEIPLQRRAFSA